MKLHKEVSPMVLCLAPLAGNANSCLITSTIPRIFPNQIQ